MGTVAYTAIDPHGEHQSGYIEAESNAEALTHLKNAGLREIRLHGDALLSERPDLDGLSDRMLRQMAAFEAESQKNPSITTDILHMLQLYRTPLILALVMIVYGIYSGTGWVGWLGAGIVLFIFGPWLYGYRDLKAFETLHRLKAFGQKDEVLTRMDRVINNPKALPQMRMQYISYKAQILACDGHTEAARELIHTHQEAMEAVSPVFYQNALSGIAYASGDYDAFIQSTRTIYDLSPQTLTAFDYAFAEARFGDVQKAEMTMNEAVNPEEIPNNTRLVYDWCQGLIHDRLGQNEAAQKHYEAMMDAYTPYRTNPAMWEMSALAIGYYAAFLARQGARETANRLLGEGTVQILNIHADDRLRERLSAALPDRIDPKPHCYRPS